MDNVDYLKIGELAHQTNIAVGTLRYYSNLGLLQPAKREDNGYRYYCQSAIQQVEFIKKAQILGFSLEEIKQVLNVRDRGEQPCDLVRSLLDHKIEQLEIQIKQMTLFKSELEEYRHAWSNQDILQLSKLKPQEVCPLISSVSLNSVASN